LTWLIVDEPREILSLCTSDEEESEDEIEQAVDRPTHGGKCPRVLFEVYGFGEDPSKTTAVKVESLESAGATEEEKTGKQISLEEKDDLIKKPKKSKKIVLEDTDNDSSTEVSSSCDTEENTATSLNSFDENEDSSATDTQNAKERGSKSKSSTKIAKRKKTKRVSWSDTEEIITTSSTSVPKKSKKRPVGVGSNKNTKKKPKRGTSEATVEKRPVLPEDTSQTHTSESKDGTTLPTNKRKSRPTTENAKQTNSKYNFRKR
jgi:hypothetical protein